ncbi:MAG TPA: sulfotransferase [Candidatus Dormibacteraeota bacterium]|nr:sulfotransferase [Candidatus Dormibacteraeota bacterium]
MTATIKRRLPTIIGAGPGRTGTTWLHRVLEGRVDLPHGVKETQFFSTYYDKGIDWYARHFRYATGERTIAEICPYLFHPLAPDRIKAHIPNCRVITTLRSPIDHSFSAYKLVTHYAWARGSFDEVLKSRPNLGGGNRYAFHLRKWFENFGRENVLVTMYDELRADPQKYLDQVTDFIGVERIALSARPEISDDVHSSDRAPKNVRLARYATRMMYWLKGRQAYGAINFLDRSGLWDFCHGRGEPYARLTSDQEEHLRQLYLPEIEALEDLLMIDLSAWKKPRVPRAGDNIAAVRASSVPRATSV